MLHISIPNDVFEVKFQILKIYPFAAGLVILCAIVLLFTGIKGSARLCIFCGNLSLIFIFVFFCIVIIIFDYRQGKLLPS